MQTSIAYNENQVKYDDTKEDTKNGFKLWTDIINPDSSEISEIKKIFDLDSSAVEALLDKSRNPRFGS
jgi:Mg2+ and Co2+ transporter CorA